MAYKNRFHKTTLGVDAEVIVTKGVAYTDDTDLKSFQANAVEGELAVFNSVTGAVLTSAAAVGDEVFIALKRDSNVERTAPFKIVAGMLKKIAYVAPVKQVSTVTTTTGIASLVDTGADITYTSRLAGLAGNDITVAYIDPSANSQPLVVSVSGTDISVSLATNGGGTITSTKTLIAAAVNAHATASQLVDATVTGTGSDVATAVAATNLAGGSASGLVIAKGSFAEVVIVETTPLLEPLPRYNYSVTAAQGESFNDLIVRLVAKINDSTNIENQNKTLIVTAAVTGGDDFTVTAIDYGVHFTVALRGILADYATAAVTTPFKVGSGTYEQAKEAELEGDVRKGVTTMYPIQNAVAADFGAPTSFADTNGTSANYVVYTITHWSEDPTRTLDKYFRKNFIFLYVVDAASDPISSLDTIFANAD